MSLDIPMTKPTTNSSINLLLLSGLDGTGVLFKPLLQTMLKELQSKTCLLIYDLNGDDNQNLDYQAKRIESQISEQFADESVVVIAESYSGLLAYQLLIRRIANIERVFFVACFLQRPSHWAYLAKYAYFIQPKWMAFINDKALKYALFNRFGSDELLALFRQAMVELEVNNHKVMLDKRCENIVNLPSSVSTKSKLTNFKIANFKITTSCVYLQANQDTLVNNDNLAVFQQLFTNLKVVRLDGSHFLLQTNADGFWRVFLDFYGV